MGSACVFVETQTPEPHLPAVSPQPALKMFIL